jgi:hypothetical protein
MSRCTATTSATSFHSDNANSIPLFIQREFDVARSNYDSIKRLLRRVRTMKPVEIKELLLSEVVQTPESLKALNDARNVMRDRIEAKLRSLMWWGLGDTYWKPWNYSKTTWAGVVDGQKPLDNFQVHICKWSDIKAGAAPRRLKYRQAGIRKVKDSGGMLKGNRRQEYPDDLSLNQLTNAYLYQLFRADNAPLGRMATLLDQIEADYSTHRVVVSVDFYYSRPLTQLGLHKDTTGNTLFVGLHYDNAEAMMGPEYIFDFWPLKDVEDRYHSPWSFDEHVNQYYWPKDLSKGLELTRLGLKEDYWKSRDLQRDTTMSQNGLITFVDELIFHVTPLTRKRTEEEKAEEDPLFRAVNINGTTHAIKDLVQQKIPKLRRTFSTKDVLDVSGTGSNGRRSFIRFWVMVEPSAWHAG